MFSAYTYEKVTVMYEGEERHALKTKDGSYVIPLESYDYIASGEEVQEVDYKKAYETLQGVYEQLHKDYEALEHSYKMRGRVIGDLKDELNQKADHNLRVGNTSLFF